VEHDLLREWAIERHVEIHADTERRLVKFAEQIYSANQKFNLTGLKSLHDIIKTLIIGSIDPFVSMKVPRGTLFADIGTGAGIPGIPLAIFCNAWKGVFIDSNNKKISFVQTAIRDCGLDNCEAYYGRIEDLIRDRMRGMYDLVFSRALGEMYYAVELSAPMLKPGGLLYIYSHIRPEEVPAPVTEHGREMGLSIVERSGYAEYGIRDTGIVFVKTGNTMDRYPRNISVIKREIQRLGKRRGEQ
jgi:16S rRNA (guanine527-N7)-methyltransferase